MMRYRAIRVDFWQDPEYDTWSFEEKSFYLYLITSPYTLLSGFMRFSPRHVMADTGLSLEKIEKLLHFLVERNKIIINGNYIWIRNFFKYQNVGGTKVYASIINELLEILDPITTSLIAEMLQLYPELQKAPGYDRLIERIEALSSDQDTVSEGENTVSGDKNTVSEGENTVPITESVSESVSVSESDNNIECFSNEKHLSAQTRADSSDLKLEKDSSQSRNDRVPCISSASIKAISCADASSLVKVEHHLSQISNGLFVPAISQK